MIGPGTAWHRFWWSEVALTRLGAFRILFSVLALFDAHFAGAIVPRDAIAYAAGGAEVSWHPMFAFELLGIGPVTPTLVEFIYPLLICSILCAMFGIASRVTCLLVALLTFYWTCQSYSFDKVHHDKVAFAIAALMLALSPCGRRLSIDSLLMRWWRAGAGRDPETAPQTSPVAGMAIRMVQVSLALGYSFPGWAKLSDPQWLNGYSLQSIMLGADNVWAETVTSNLLLAQFLSVGLVTIQATFLLVFVFPKLRWFYLPGAVSFHMGTWATMDTGPYITLWFLLVAFLALERVPLWVVGMLRDGPVWRRIATIPVVAIPMSLVLYVLLHTLPWGYGLLLIPPSIAFVLLFSRRKLEIIYDGGCGMCSHAAAVIAGLDWSQQIRFHDLTEWQAVAKAFPHLDQAACILDMHSIEHGGRTDVGYASYQRIAWRLPLIMPFAWLLYLPPVPQIGRRIYRRVADGRQSTSCGLSSSPADPSP